MYFTIVSCFKPYCFTHFCLHFMDARGIKTVLRRFFLRGIAERQNREHKLSRRNSQNPIGRFHAILKGIHADPDTPESLGDGAEPEMFGANCHVGRRDLGKALARGVTDRDNRERRRGDRARIAADLRQGLEPLGLSRCRTPRGADFPPMAPPFRREALPPVFPLPPPAPQTFSHFFSRKFL